MNVTDKKGTATPQASVAVGAVNEFVRADVWGRWGGRDWTKTQYVYRGVRPRSVAVCSDPDLDGELLATIGEAVE